MAGYKEMKTQNTNRDERNMDLANKLNSKYLISYEDFMVFVAAEDNIKTEEDLTKILMLVEQYRRTAKINGSIEAYTELDFLAEMLRYTLHQCYGDNPKYGEVPFRTKRNGFKLWYHVYCNYAEHEGTNILKRCLNHISTYLD